VRQGFSYISFLIYLAAIVVVSSVFLPTCFKLMRDSYTANQNMRNTAFITGVMDDLTETIGLADQVKLGSDNFVVYQDSEIWEYSVYKERLIKKKLGIVYLTPTEIKVTKLSPTQVSAKLVAIDLETSCGSFKRKIKLRNAP
jgi:hypothetical protein